MDTIVKVELLDSSIVKITLNRPQQFNALSQDVLKKLSAIFTDIKNDASIKAVLLAGEGKAFCAGADIKQLAALNGPEGLAFARFGQSVFRQLETLGKPSLAAMHGFVFGGGLELAMSATMRIAADNTQMGQPEIKLGVIPGFGGTQRLTRLVGKGRSMELCLTGRRISAEEAVRIGLINEVTSPDELLPRAEAILKELTALPPVALQSIMTVINDGADLSLTDALELEAVHFGLCCTTRDKQEGVSAFIEKRTAVFSGE
jgi:enoyl-CoA hydratase